jgi:hypothetical protein
LRDVEIDVEKINSLEKSTKYMVSDFHSCKEMQLFVLDMVILMLEWRGGKKQVKKREVA